MSWRTQNKKNCSSNSLSVQSFQNVEKPLSGIDQAVPSIFKIVFSQCNPNISHS